MEVSDLYKQAVLALIITLVMVIPALASHRNEKLPGSKQTSLNLDEKNDPKDLVRSGFMLVDQNQFTVEGSQESDYSLYFLVNPENGDKAVVVYSLADKEANQNGSALCVFWARWDAQDALLEWAGDREWEHHRAPKVTKL